MQTHTFCKVITVACLTLLGSGCTVMMHTLTNQEKVFQATDEKKIMITTKDRLPQNFTEVGFITVTEDNIEKAKVKMRKQAAKFGGDAVIDFKVTVIRQFILILVIPVPIDQYICRGRVVRTL